MGPIFGSSGGGGNQQPFGSQFDPSNPAGGMPPDFSGQGPDQTSPDASQSDPFVANDWTGGSGLTQNIGSWPGGDNPVYAAQAQADLSRPPGAQGSSNGQQSGQAQQRSFLDELKNLIVPSAEASTIRMKQPSGATTSSPGWIQSQTTPPWSGASQTPAPIEQDPAAGEHATDIFQQFRDMLFGKPAGPAPQPPPLTETGTGTPAPGTPVPQPRPGAAGQDLGRPTPIPQPRPGVPGQDLGIPTPQPRPGAPGQDLGTSNIPKVGAGGGMVEAPPEAGGSTPGATPETGGGTAPGESAGATPNLLSGPFNPLRLIIDLLSGNMGDLMRWFQGQPFQGKEGSPFGQFGPGQQGQPKAPDTVSPQSTPDSGKTTPPSMTLPWPGGPAGAAPVPAPAQTAPFADRFNAIARGAPEAPLSAPGAIPGTLGIPPGALPAGPLMGAPGGQNAPQAAPGGGIPAPQRNQQLSFNDPFVRQMAQIESSGIARSSDHGNYGLFRFSPDQYRELGITNPYDPQQQLRALQIETTKNMSRARQVLGRDPTGAELYLMHQQGGAALPLISAAQNNPNAPAWQVATPAYRYNRNPSSSAMRAIRQNILDTSPLKHRPVEQVTAKDFVQMWTDRFNRTSQSRMRPGMTPDMRQRLQGQARSTAYEGQQGLDRARQQEFPQRISALAPPGNPNPFPPHRPARNIDSPNINERRNPGVVHDFGPTNDATYMQDWYPLLNTNLQRYRSDTFQDRFQGEPR